MKHCPSLSVAHVTDMNGARTRTRANLMLEIGYMAREAEHTDLAQSPLSPYTAIIFQILTRSAVKNMVVESRQYENLFL